MSERKRVYMCEGIIMEDWAGVGNHSTPHSFFYLVGANSRVEASRIVREALEYMHADKTSEYYSAYFMVDGVASVIELDLATIGELAEKLASGGRSFYKFPFVKREEGE